MIVVFAGPTIAEEQVHTIIDDATVRPPASMGDIYRAAQSRPHAIGIIDGYFEAIPSVWHKEILWALNSGIPIYGASSMGALRAAEMHPFGMTGVGEIFEQYRDGILEDDDEVALQHAPKELNFAPLSEPMVNIRATLKRAVQEGIVDTELESSLIRLAKGRFYPERTWDNLFDDALRQPADIGKTERLRNWLPGGKVDQKLDDAVAMLQAIRERGQTAHTGALEEIDFQHTVMWETLTRSVEDTEQIKTSLMIDCLRSDPVQYRHFRERAAKSLVSEMDDIEATETVPKGEISRALTNFRTQHQLYTARSLDEWLAANGLELQQLENNLAREISEDTLIKANPDLFRSKILMELQNEGLGEKLEIRSGMILEIGEQTGLLNATPEDLGTSKIGLQMWYFETLLEIPMPDDLDYFLDKNDFLDRNEFERVMVLQFICWREQQDP